MRLIAAGIYAYTTREYHNFNILKCQNASLCSQNLNAYYDQRAHLRWQHLFSDIFFLVVSVASCSLTIRDTHKTHRVLCGVSVELCWSCCSSIGSVVSLKNESAFLWNFELNFPLHIYDVVFIDVINDIHLPIRSNVFVCVYVLHEYSTIRLCMRAHPNWFNEMHTWFKCK